MGKIVGCITFSASTKDNVDEDVLGSRITAWMQANPFAVMEEKYVVMSDNYISILIFYSGQAGEVNPLDKI